MAGDASIISIAINFSSRKPKYIAKGIKIIGCKTNLIFDAIKEGLIFFMDFLPSKERPTVKSANGVAIDPKLDIDLLMINGNLISRYEAKIPANIANIIGFLQISIAIFLKLLESFESDS